MQHHHKVSAIAQMEKALAFLDLPSNAIIGDYLWTKAVEWLHANPAALLELNEDLGLLGRDGNAFVPRASRIEPLAETDAQ